MPTFCEHNRAAKEQTDEASKPREAGTAIASMHLVTEALGHFNDESHKTHNEANHEQPGEDVEQ